MPSKDKNQTPRQRKKDKKSKFDINGKYSSKHVRLKEAMLEKQKLNEQKNKSKK
jgi:hypothetical protein